MAVTPDSLMAPAGPVSPTLFPGVGDNELRESLSVYISTAQAHPAVVAAPGDRVDGMTRNYALYLAFQDVYIRMNTQPLTLTVADKGAHGYGIEQIRNIRDLMNKYLADFEALIIPVGTIRPGLTPGTISVPTDVRW
jgi:hypothetical protein